MYKTEKYHQITFFEFNQSCGIQLDPNNEWVILADRIPWSEIEKTYAAMFPSHTGRPAKPLRMALGSLIVQKAKKLADRKLLKEITENPYVQYFIGLEAFTHECPFTAPALVSFRKRIDAGFLMKINDLYLEKAGKTREHQNDRAETVSDPAENRGTVIIDATCSPSNIEYPQDFSLLNQARVKLEEMIDYLHKNYSPYPKPRTYRMNARKEYLALAKAKKRPAKKIRAFIRKHLGYIWRDLGYIDRYLGMGCELPEKYTDCLETIRELYKQQKYMYDNKVHRVDNRIVSISQPWIRPIVRGKADKPVEFGVKYDVSIDELGHARMEKLSFDPYNESSIFQGVVERYKKRTGHYPERALVDQIYRTRSNRAYCKEHGIRMSGPKLGRPQKDSGNKSRTSKEEYKDNTDRSEVERFFSLDKRCYGAGLIMVRLQDTTLASVALSVLVTNMFHIPAGTLFDFLPIWIIFDEITLLRPGSETVPEDEIPENGTY